MPGVVSFASVGGVSSGSGSTPATARNLGYALTQSDWDELRIIRSALDDQYVIVPSGATGNQINQILCDFPTGTSSLWKTITGCNSSGEVNGAMPTITCSGFGSGVGSISMLVFKPSQEYVELASVILDGASSGVGSGSYNLANNSGRTDAVIGTNTTSATWKFRLNNVIGRNSRHNPFSFWGGQAGAFPRHGLEVFGCNIGAGSGADGGNGCIIARPGTGGNCLSVLVQDSYLGEMVTGNGLFVNAGANACDVTVINSVLKGSSSIGNCLNVNTTGVVTVRRSVLFGSGLNGILINSAQEPSSVTVEDSVIASNGSYAVDDGAYIAGSTTNRIYRNCLVWGNTLGEMSVGDDGAGGTGPIDLVGTGHRRTAPTFNLSTGRTLTELSVVNGDALARRGFGSGRLDFGVLSRRVPSRARLSGV